MLGARVAETISGADIMSVQTGHMIASDPTTRPTLLASKGPSTYENWVLISRYFAAIEQASPQRSTEGAKVKRHFDRAVRRRFGDALKARPLGPTVDFRGRTRRQ